MTSYILITGGTGYIGSHACVELINLGYHIIIVDNLVNSKESVVDKINQITNKPDHLIFHKVDLLNVSDLENVFSKYKDAIKYVIHFAGLKAVAESVKEPLLYYQNNLFGSINLFQIMQKYKCKNVIFSSSATVYGSNSVPYKEDMVAGIGITNPYGQTKHMIEQILSDLYASDKSWNITVLRYFNPVAHHSSGLIRENPNGTPNNLMPYILKAAAGEIKTLTIFGKDYDTPDGTCVRDFIHVVDVAKGHIAALVKLGGYQVYNLGTGKGTSVLQLINMYEKESGVKINYVFGARREGDLPVVYADVTKAREKLDWASEEKKLV